MRLKHFRGWIFLLSLLAAAGLAGCAALNPTVAALEKAKKYYSEGRYEAAADLRVDCSRTDPGCSQLNLVTGDACFRLAKSAEVEGGKETVVSRYRCAVNRLEAGIAMTESSPSPKVLHTQYYENLCESLRSWQDMEKGEAARQLSRRLSDVSERFLTRHPGHPAAVYFVVSARFALASADFWATPVPDDLCRRLQDMIHALETAFPEAQGTRYESNYQRLLTDLHGARRAVAGCR